MFNVFLKYLRVISSPSWEKKSQIAYFIPRLKELFNQFLLCKSIVINNIILISCNY